MAEPSTPAKTGSKSSFGFLTRKIGPAPVWVWGAIAFGGYYWYTHRKGKAAAPAAGRPGGGRTVIEVRGPRGPAGPPGPGGGEDRDRDDHHRRRRHRRRLPPWRFPGEGAAPPAMEVPEPVPAAAPMTGAGIYGDVPVATSEGTFYDSGQPLEGQYVPAG